MSEESARHGAAEPPLVSVILPAFNAEATLDETLRSALAQSLRAIEVIVVDDGSTDRTGQIARSFADGDARVRVIRTANRGPGAARNLALARARGRFVAPLDADDLWHPRKLEKQIAAALAAEPVPGFVYCFFRGIDGAGNVLPPAESLVLNGRIFFRHIYKNVVGNGSGALFLRSAMLEAGGYDESLDCEDHHLQLRIARRHEVRSVAEFLVGYRVREGSGSADRLANYRGWIEAMARIDGEFGPLPARLMRWSRAAKAGDAVAGCLRAGRRLAAARLLLRALAGDPVRTVYRVADQLARGLGRHAPAPRRRFETFSPSEPPPEEAEGVNWASQRLRRLDGKRMGRLGAIEHGC